VGIISEYLKNKHRSRFVDEIMTIKKTSSIDFVGVGLTFTRSIDDIKIKVKIPPPAERTSYKTDYYRHTGLTIYDNRLKKQRGRSHARGGVSRHCWTGGVLFKSEPEKR